MIEIELKEISERMKTQDNRYTQDPIFIVYELEKVTSHPDYTDKFKYVFSDGDGEIGDTKESVIEYCKDNEMDLPDNVEGISQYDFDSWIDDHSEFNKWHYKELRKFVGVFFTEKSAQRHIDQNSYHYRKPHIYVHSLWRNYEMQAVQQALLEGRFTERGDPQSNPKPKQKESK